METIVLFFLLCRRWGLFVFVGLALLLPAPAVADETVTVTAASGRQFTGIIHARTDRAQLWLQTGSADVQIVRPLDWNRVVRVRWDQQELTGQAFRERLLSKPKARDTVGGQRVLHLRSATASSAPSDEAPPPVVRSLAIDAVAANWDDDVEPDGMLLQLAPLDESGRVTAVDGTLEVELFGLGRLDWPTAERIEKLARWTEIVHADQFAADGAEVRLPFQAVHPEFVRHLETPGAVHARLTVPGQGVFDATCEPIVVRSPSVVRHRLDQLQGTRFLPGERTGRGQEWHTPGWIEPR